MTTSLRQRRGDWTQVQVAQQLGISRSYYGMIEIGQRNPTLKLAGRMAGLFGVSVDTLFFGEQRHETQQRQHGEQGLTRDRQPPRPGEGADDRQGTASVP